MEDRPGAPAPPIEDSADRARASAGEALHDVKHAAKDMASSVKDKAKETAYEAQAKAADQTRTAANTLRDTASGLDGDLPWMKTALNKTADGFDHLTRAINRGDPA